MVVRSITCVQLQCATVSPLSQISLKTILKALTPALDAMTIKPVMTRW